MKTKVRRICKSRTESAFNSLAHKKETVQFLLHGHKVQFLHNLLVFSRIVVASRATWNFKLLGPLHYDWKPLANDGWITIGS